MAHKWKFTVNDDGSFTAEIVRPEDHIHDCFEKEAFRALKNEVDRLKGLLKDAVEFIESSTEPLQRVCKDAGLTPLSVAWREKAREAIR